MELLTLLSFVGAAFIVTIMPGPDNLFVLTQSITRGKYAGMFTTLGLCSGLLVHITAAAVGVSALVYQSPLAFNIIKYAGAVYLIYLAYLSFKDTGSTIDLKTNDEKLNSKALYYRGVIMNLLNPKVALFFLAFFPQFISEDGINIPVQMIILGFIFLIQTLIIFNLISIFSSIIGTYLKRNVAISRRMNIIQGVLFVMIALTIIMND